MKWKKNLTQDIESFLTCLVMLNKKILKKYTIKNKMNIKINIKTIIISKNKITKSTNRQNQKEEDSLKVTKIFLTHDYIYFNCIF